MPDLETFQLAFAAAVGRGGRRGALESQPGFAVYRNTTPNALIEVLRANYPVTDRIVGGMGFDELAFEFARRHPPADPVLIGYGEGFADFLDAQPWIPELPYLPGIARLERLWTESHIAADAPVLSLRDLCGIGPDGWSVLRLPLHPSARTLWSRMPVVTIWLAHREDGFECLEPVWQAEGALIVRPGGEVAVSPIGAPAHRLLSGLRLGETIGQAASAVAGLYPEADIPLLLTTLINRGAFTRPPHLERNA